MEIEEDWKIISPPLVVFSLVCSWLPINAIPLLCLVALQVYSTIKYVFVTTSLILPRNPNTWYLFKVSLFKVNPVFGWCLGATPTSCWARTAASPPCWCWQAATACRMWGAGWRGTMRASRGRCLTTTLRVWGPCWTSCTQHSELLKKVPGCYVSSHFVFQIQSLFYCF